jgi:hypothetical protein
MTVDSYRESIAMMIREDWCRITRNTHYRKPRWTSAANQDGDGHQGSRRQAVPWAFRVGRLIQEGYDGEYDYG